MHDGIEENLRFLIIEVRKQLSRTSLYLRQPSATLARQVATADDYIDNLKTIIQRKSFVAAAEALSAPSESVDSLRTFETVASNLERIADFCEKVLDQVAHVDRPLVREAYDFTEFVDEIEAGVSLVERSVFERDVRIALGICRTEHTLDQMYARVFKRVLEDLRANEGGEKTQSLVTMLFIAHYLERMGDALLNIGESMLSAHLGERIKIGQLRTLEHSLDKTELASPLADLSMRAMGETKSGARVASLHTNVAAGASASRPVIFKEGKAKKLAEERAAIERWEQLVPGVAPKIFSYHHEGEHGAILLEYVPGSTFESILFERPPVDVQRALVAIQDKLVAIWSATRSPKPAAAHFLRQLAKRYDDVLAVHPDFGAKNAKIGDMAVDSFGTLVERLRDLDERLRAPFSVFIHGDFNLDNVIYDDTEGSVRFIDLHRSTMMDYVQDVSVFLVSHFRLRVLDASSQRVVKSAMLRFYDFATHYADSAGDATFAERLALGVARSMATSTRFVLDRKLAQDMFLRSRYLLERSAEARAGRRRLDRHLTREVLVD